MDWALDYDLLHLCLIVGLVWWYVMDCEFCTSTDFLRANAVACLIALSLSGEPFLRMTVSLLVNVLWSEDWISRGSYIPWKRLFFGLQLAVLEPMKFFVSVLEKGWYGV